jgi:RNA polymerase-binding transcription factor DksA
MNAATLRPAAFRERLLGRLDEIDRQLTDLKLSLAEATDSQWDEGTLANHPADEATDMLRAETDLSRIYELYEEQRDIAGAFERMENGRFGICTDCGTRIAPGRLEVIPVAKRCLTCQMHKEDRHRPRRTTRRIGVEETFRV